MQPLGLAVFLVRLRPDIDQWDPSELPEDVASEFGRAYRH